MAEPQIRNQEMVRKLRLLHLMLLHIHPSIFESEYALIKHTYMYT